MRPQTQASETILHVLRQQALHRGSALAHAVGDAAVTFGDLWNDVRAIAATLGRYGVESRDRCALVLPTGLDLIRLIFAVQMRRAVPIVLNPDVADVVTAGRLARLRTALVVAEPDRAAGLESQVSASGGRVVVADELTRPRSAPMIAAWPEPNDIAYLQLTAGTTGESRAAVVTHASLMASLEGSRRRLGITDTDVFASWIPLHHDFGLVRFVFGSVYAGCPSHLVPVSLTNLRPWLETMDRVRASITGGPDIGYRTAAQLVSSNGLNLSSLRVATNGGEGVRRSTIEMFESRFGLPGVIRPGYGLAEATLAVTCVAPGEALSVDAAGTVGCGAPLDGVTLRIVDSDGRPVGPLTEGEIQVRGACVFAGYFDDEPQSRAKLRGGWLHTGDIGCLDESGRLFVKGRARSLIKRGGAALAPKEIEEVVDGIPEVRLSAALGLAGLEFAVEERLVIVAELRGESVSYPADAAALTSRIAQHVAQRFGVMPFQVLLVEPGGIPLTASGKVQHAEVSARLRSGRLAELFFTD